jgi:ABC-type Na+ efflux pump permease subunit
MMRDALFIARKDFQYMIRARETLFWVFAMPILFFYFIGTMTGSQTSGKTKEKLAVRSAGNGGFLFEQLARRLQEQEYELVFAETDSTFAAYRRRLSVPTGLTDSVLAGIPVKLHFARSEDGTGFDYDSLRIRRAVYTVLADLIVTSRDGAPTEQAFQRLNDTPRALSLDVRPAGKRRIVPTGFSQAIPGIMVMFTLLVMTTSGAVLLVIERRQGLLRRLAYTPIDRLSVVLGKWGGKFALGLLQIAVAMASGTLLFKMEWGPNFPLVMVVMIAYGGLMASVGLLLGSVARTEGQAVGIGVVSSNVLAALGGCWWPVEVTPAWMQRLQLVLPTGWAMNALHKLISFEAPASSILPLLGVIISAAVVVLLLARRLFRFQ